MKKLHTTAAPKLSVAACIGMGVFVALVISFALTLLLSALVQSNSIKESDSVGVFLIRMVAAMGGSWIGCALTDKGVLPVAGMIALGYLVILFAVGLLVLDGMLTCNLGGVLSIIMGSGLVCVIKLKSQRRRRKPVRYAK